MTAWKGALPVSQGKRSSFWIKGLSECKRVEGSDVMRGQMVGSCHVQCWKQLMMLLTGRRSSKRSRVDGDCDERVTISEERSCLMTVQGQGLEERCAVQLSSE